MREPRRSLLNIQVEPDECVQVHVLTNGEVRLRVNNDPAREILTATLEDLLQDAAAWPDLSMETYEQLHWELDLLALRGG